MRHGGAFSVLHCETLEDQLKDIRMPIFRWYFCCQLLLFCHLLLALDPIPPVSAIWQVGRCKRSYVQPEKLLEQLSRSKSRWWTRREGRMDGRDSGVNHYATEQRLVRPVWIIIELDRAQLLHKQRALYQTACILSSGFESHTKPYFNTTSKLPTRKTATKKPKDTNKTN